MLKKGDRLRLRALGSDDDWCEAIVALASPNGQSLYLLLEGMVRSKDGFFKNGIPLIIDEEQGQVLDLFGGEYEVEVPDTGYVN
jgi:hypothetical protein